MQLAGLEKVGLSAAAAFLVCIVLQQPVYIRCLIKWIPVACFYATLRMRPALETTSIEAWNRRWITIGLILGALADIIIEVDSLKECFLAGVGIFWLEHVCYIVALWPAFRARIGPAPVLAMWTGPMAVMMWFYAPDMRAFILPYIGVIAVMMYLALCQTESPQFNCRSSEEVRARQVMMASGAVIFGISDSLIAVRKFLLIPFLHHGWASGQILDAFEDLGMSEAGIVIAIRLLIMTTYWLGQFLIARGASWDKVKAPKHVL